jgi:hypothetical protein
MKLAILHFQPLEKYPPVMNCIRDLEELTTVDVYVFSTKHIENRFTTKYKCFRFGNYAKSLLARYWTYLYFNISTFLLLLITKPTTILYFETYSVWPAYWYLRLFPKTNLYIHFHEYYSASEKISSSSYFKFLLKLEEKLLYKAKWISHTNKDRLNLFEHDFLHLNKGQFFTLPNYPPHEWLCTAQTIRNNHTTESNSIKVIYIGAIGISSTYIVEFSNWLHQQNGTYTFSIYTDNIEQEARDYLLKLNSPYIHLNSSLPYYQLPSVLAQFDIGIVFYKGHIPNYVYNVPNKVFEYLVCGLQVWYSKELLSTQSFQLEYDLHNMTILDFTNLSTIESQFHIHKADLSRIEFPENKLIAHLISNENQ